MSTSQQTRPSGGFYVPPGSTLSVVIESLLALLGLGIWGPSHLGTALLAAPIVYRVLRRMATAITYLLLGLALEGTMTRLLMCSCGPWKWDVSTGRARVTWHRDATLAEGVVVLGASLKPGVARVERRLRMMQVLLLICVLLLVTASIRGLLTHGSPSMLFVVELLALVFARLFLLLGHLRESARAAGERANEAATDALRALWTRLCAGEPLRRISHDLVERSHLDSHWLPARAQGHLLTYFMMADRGNWTAAVRSLDQALEVAEEWRLAPIQMPLPLVGEVYGVAAAHIAWFEGDADRAEQVLRIVGEAWMSPAERALAQAAVALRRGEWSRAEADGHRAVAEAPRQLPLSTAMLLTEWANAMVSAARQRVPGHKAITLPRLVFTPPIMLALTKFRRRNTAVNWALQSLRPFFLMGLAWQVDNQRPLDLMVISIAGLIVTSAGIAFTRAWLSHSALELSPAGVVYRAQHVNARYPWHEGIGVGRLGKTRVHDLGLCVAPEAAARLPRGAFKGGVPVAAFEKGWEDGTIGEIVRRFAPQALEPVPRLSQPGP